MPKSWKHFEKKMKTYHKPQEENHGDVEIRYQSNQHFAKNVVRPGYVWFYAWLSKTEHFQFCIVNSIVNV